MQRFCHWTSMQHTRPACSSLTRQGMTESFYSASLPTAHTASSLSTSRSWSRSARTPHAWRTGCGLTQGVWRHTSGSPGSSDKRSRRQPAWPECERILDNRNLAAQPADFHGRGLHDGRSKRHASRGRAPTRLGRSSQDLGRSGRVKANCNWFKEHSGEYPTWLGYTTVGPGQKWTTHRGWLSKHQKYVTSKTATSKDHNIQRISKIA